MYKQITMALVLAIALLVPTELTAVTVPMVKADEVVAEPEKPIVLTPAELIKQEFGPNHVMYYVALAESGERDPITKEYLPCVNNVNPTSTARGCFQILKGTFADPYYGCTGDRMKIEDNVACAKKIYAKSGTRPWNASKHNWQKWYNASITN